MDSLLSLKTENGASQDQHPAHRPHLRRPSLHLRQAEKLSEAGEFINLMITIVVQTTHTNADHCKMLSGALAPALDSGRRP